MTNPIEVKFDLSDVKDDLDKQVKDIFNKVLKSDIPRILSKHDLQDPESYQLLLRNRGQQKRRKLSTIRAEYLKLGKNQPEFTFVVGGEDSFENVIEIAQEALSIAIKRAPVHSGEYLRNLGYYAGSRSFMVRLSSSGLRQFNFGPGDSVFITSLVEYASTIEAGFYKGIYQTETLKGGILASAARTVSRRFGNQVAVSFGYYSINGGTVPAIRIGPLGSFNPRFARPGSAAERKARRNRKGK